MSALALPAIPAELKSISPYLQRADELVKKDPVVAYWCAYYAAQVGISLKIKDTPSRNLLFELLAVLERLKKEIGPNDAVDIENVSAAYVENFALKVFSMADNEDRKGEATRSTAKKFLAAANFLEVLRVFPKSDISESNGEKIKYSKWKATDIAKAYREGRKPAPGPAGSENEPSSSSETLTSSAPPSSNLDVVYSPPSPKFNEKETSPRTSPKRTTPPPHMEPGDITRANLPRTSNQSLEVNHTNEDNDGTNPGTWSTTATPGFDLADRTPFTSNDDSIDDDLRRARQKDRKSALRQAWVSDDVENITSDEERETTAAAYFQSTMTTSPPRKVHFSPPVSNATSDTVPSPPVSPTHAMISTSTSAPYDYIPPSSSPVLVMPPSSPCVLSIPPSSSSSQNGAPPRSHGGRGSRSSQDRETLPRGFMPTHVLPGPPGPPVVSSPATGPSTPPPSPPHRQPHHHVVPNIPAYAPPPAPAPVYAAYTAPSAHPVELTPSVIAKAQKHCRFAISALDYEDAEQARKELRAALAALGE
ncbi:hypothetical protein SERLA73DRAFT_190014 [Serpula lacrymans var. lacrymans S7.3]|uniref:DUF605-domain-containing protein n=1 Tax=Serpula lacrymans var. lacrymans (strain S7.3) TaxID=936435 RepID=F8QEX9_SERL3|nr:hypothetical protein SERLA73DRAFT_190014 [Serpula lacrymans var. lacrymans S7.3]